MNINQINTSIPNIANYHNKTIEFNGLDIFIQYNECSMRTELTIFQDNQEIGFIYLDSHQVKCSDIYPQSRGKGIGRSVYRLILEINEIIISDNCVSPLAFNVYDSLSREFKMIEHPRLKLDEIGYRAPQWCFIIKK